MRAGSEAICGSALTGLAAAMFALPLAQSSWHGPEVASTLAVSAVALLAGQRWAIAVIVIAELFLLPTIWPRAFFGGVEHLAGPHRGARLARRDRARPSVGAPRRRRARHHHRLSRTQLTCRRFQYGFVALGLLDRAAAAALSASGRARRRSTCAVET